MFTNNHEQDKKYKQHCIEGNCGEPGQLLEHLYQLLALAIHPRLTCTSCVSRSPDLGVSGKGCSRF